jgi:hypothetical protein
MRGPWRRIWGWRKPCGAGGSPRWQWSLGWRIETALRRTRAARVLFLSCDMPFLTMALVERLLEVQHSAVFTESEKMAGFPFCLSKGLLPSVEASLEAGELSVQAFARRYGSGWLSHGVIGHNWLTLIRQPNSPRRARPCNRIGGRYHWGELTQ